MREAENRRYTEDQLKKQIAELTRELNQGKIDAGKAEILDMYRGGPHVVLKVQYPNCKKCSYEGVKILVYLNVTEAQIIRWRTIDPHFRDPSLDKQSITEAPSPAARFPASPDGWADAMAYVASKV